MLLFTLPGCGSESQSGGPRAVIRTPELSFVHGPPDPAIPPQVQVLHRGNGAEPQSLDPHKSEGVPSSNILRDLFEGLVGEAPDGSLIPAGAERWEISDGGMKYLFHIRRDGRWSNGDPVTAQDFAYGLRRSVDPATASEYAQMLAPILNAEAAIAGDLPPAALGVRVLNPYLLEIRLKVPTSYFTGMLAHSSTYPVHQGNVEAFGDQFARPGKLISNGAFQVVEWVVRSHISLEPNLHYRDAEQIVLDRVVYHAMEDPGVAVKRYRAGELHWTDTLPNNQFKWIKQHLPQELVISPYLGVYYFGFNLTQSPFKDNRPLRVALSMALEREILAEKVMQFGERPQYAYVPPGIPGYQPQPVEWAQWPAQKRVARAVELYNQAGYSRQHPLEVEIRYNTNENHKKVALAVGAMWKQNLGVRVRLINEEWKVFLENRKQRQKTEVFRAGWIGDYSDANNFLEILHSRHGGNDPGFNNAAYDELLSRAAGEVDRAARVVLMQEAEQMVLAEMPIMPMYSYVTKRLVKPFVKGWQSNVMDHHYSKNIYLLKHWVEEE